MSSAAMAEIDGGVYVGAGVGLGVNARSCNGNDPCERVSGGTKLFGGLRMTPTLAAEVNYFVFGKVRQGTNSLPELPGSATGSRATSRTDTADSARAVAIGINWQVEMFSRVTNDIRLGLASVRYDSTRTFATTTRRSDAAVSFPVYSQTSERSYETVPYLGLGLSAKLSPYVRVFTGWDFLINGHKSLHMLGGGVSVELDADRSAAEYGKTYVGGALGGSQINFDCVPGSKCDKTNLAMKAYAGVSISRFLAVEAGYMNLGKLEGAFDGANPVFDISGSAYTVGLAMRLPIAQRFTGVGRIGLAAVKTSFKQSGGDSSIENHEGEPYFGIGAEYELSRRLKLVGTIDTTKMALDTTKKSVNLVTFGAQTDF